MSDTDMLRVGLAADWQLRWAAVDITAAVEEARRRLDLAPVPAIAFGRCAAAACMLLRLATKTPRRLEIDVRGDGPMGRVLAEVSSDGGLRGLVGNAHAVGVGGSDDYRVGPAVGKGLMKIRRLEREGRFYESQVELVTGEIGTDVAHYLAQSEQRPSAVLVGVLALPSGIGAAGGVIIEALPGAPGTVVEAVEARVREIPSVSRLLEEGGITGAVSQILGDLEPVELERSAVAYRCSCDRARLAQSLATLPEPDLTELVSADGTIEAECAYCGERYRYRATEILPSGPN